MVSVALEQEGDALGKTVAHGGNGALEHRRVVARAELRRLIRSVRAMLHVVAHLNMPTFLLFHPC